MADDKDVEGLAKAYEAILTSAAARREPEKEPAEAKAKPRDILFRGTVYSFRPIGPASGPARRTGVVERWQSDVHVDDGAGYNVIVDEFYDGRFTPWSFDGIFFTDFMQAVIVGLVTGSLESRWHEEKWQHERTRHRFLFLVVPAVLVVALVVGIIIGLRHG
jgi:hypothetical protein